MSGEHHGPAPIDTTGAHEIEDLGAHPDAAAASELQRLRIHVPNVKTTVSMGAKAEGGHPREEDTGAPNYKGFGVHTLGHVFIDARSGVAADSKMGLQANGQIVVQSDKDSLYLVSNGSNVLATPAVVNLAGGSGIILAAGSWVGVPENLESTAADTGPEAPHAITHLPHGLEEIGKWWMVVDGSMAAAAIASSVLQHKFANHKSLAAAAVAVGTNLANMAAAVCVANNAIGKLWHEPIPGGVTIHGTSGLIAGTPAYAGIYGGLGLTMGSLFSTVVGVGEVALISPKTISATSGNQIEITAYKHATILAGHKIEFAAKHGDIAMKAEYISVGSGDGEGGQHPTKGVAIFGEKTVWASSQAYAFFTGKDVGVFAENAASYAAKTMTLSGEDKVGITSKKEVELSGPKAGMRSDKFFIKMDDSSLTIGNIQEKRPPVPVMGGDLSAAEVARRYKELVENGPSKELKDLVAPEIEAYQKKCDDWLKEVYAMEAKDSSVTLKDGTITLEVQGHKFVVDSSTIKLGDVLKCVK